VAFYFRKSVKVGPLRFNLSKSGIGVSAGIPGFRVGAGPRGNYVHMGRGGLYYRAALGTGRSAPSPVPSPSPTADNGQLREIESASALQMVDESSAALLEEINAKLKATVWWPFVLGAALLGVLVVTEQGAVLISAVAAAGAAATWLVYQRDVLRTSVVLLYDLEDAAIEQYQAFHDAFDALVRCGRVGHIAAQGAVQDRKRQAGAGAVVRRHVIRPAKRPPSRVKTNIEVPVIPVGRQMLHFFPDRLLVIDHNGAGAIGYADLQLDTRQSQFIEREGVPADAQVIGRTWQYVNKSGGPDRRFKSNPEIPIALYEEIHLTSATGLNEVIQVSKVGTGEQLRQGIKRLVAPNRGALAV
jgi:Protein of unknown function (DUF4236)